MTLRTIVGPASSLCETVERAVHARTNGMVRDLQVDLVDGELVVTGHTNTFYSKQLATHAALEVVDQEAEPPLLTNAILVH